MKTLFIIIFSALSVSIMAQDQIILKNGEDIQARVTEITPDFIKYKRFEHLDGPTISVNKHEILFIKYENGTKELFTVESHQQSSSQSSSFQEESPTNVSSNPSKGNKAEYYLQDDMLLFGGVASEISGEALSGVGFYLGLERAYYLNPSLALTAHISSTYNPVKENYWSLNGGMLNTFFLAGLQARSRNADTQVYGMALIGSTWTLFTGDFSESDQVWAATIGLGTGIVLNDIIDIGLRFSYDPANEFPFLQLGAGIHF